MIRVTCVELLTYLYPCVAPSAIHIELSLLHTMTCLPSGRIHLIPPATVPIRLQTNLVFSPGYAPAMQWIAAFASPTKWFCLLNAKDNTKWCVSICVCKYMYTYINIYSETPLHRTLRKPKCPQNQICFGPKSYTAWTTTFNPWNKKKQNKKLLDSEYQTIYLVSCSFNTNLTSEDWTINNMQGRCQLYKAWHAHAQCNMSGLCSSVIQLVYVSGDWLSLKMPSSVT